MLAAWRPEWLPPLPAQRRTLAQADGSAGYRSLLVLVMASAVAGVLLVDSYPAMLQATGREFAPPADEVFMVGFGGAVLAAFVLSLLDAGLRLHWLSPLARRVAFVLLPPLMLIFLVLGTVYLGVATPTEAGALGAVGAVVLALARRRLTRRNAAQALLETSKLSCMVMFVLIGATFFSHSFQALEGRLWVEQLFADLPGGATGFLVFVTALIFVLGLFLDFFEIAFVLLPLLAPVAHEAGHRPGVVRHPGRREPAGLVHDAAVRLLAVLPARRRAARRTRSIPTAAGRCPASAPTTSTSACCPSSACRCWCWGCSSPGRRWCCARPPPRRWMPPR